jgi:hypothetical protein
MTKLQLIEKVIKDFDLKSTCRSKQYIYRRYYLYNQLRELKCTLTEIGEMFGGKHYATVLNGLKQHHDLYRFGYEDYKIVMNQMDDALNGATLPFMSDAPDLVNDILEAKTYPQFKKIQKHIKLGKYETNSSI